MVDIVEAADLREEAGKGLVVAGSIVDGTGPVVGPLDHGARLQAVRTHLVDVIAIRARVRGRPVAEREEVL